jgi:hypothetical protein
MLLVIAGFGIKMIFKKNGKFEKKCSVINPKTGEKISACYRCEEECAEKP